MHYFITIPPRIYRAFKRLPMKEHTAKPNQRCAEFVRLGVTAYDFTLTYSDSYFLVRCEWPKPKTWGNEHDGMYWYLTKTEFANLGKGATFAVPECSTSPFQGGDMLKDVVVKDFINLNADGYKKKNRKPSSVKHIDARYLASLTRTIDMILSEDKCIQVDFGCDELVPALMVASDELVHILGIVMPIRK